MIRVKSAMLSRIKGVFFDYGGVIEDLSFDESTLQKGVNILNAVLREHRIDTVSERLFRMLKRGQEEYTLWYQSNDERELSNEEMWTSFYLRELCVDPAARSIVEPMSEELSSIYEYYLYRRRPSKDVRNVLKTLAYSGYTLALISNTMSKTLIPERLRKLRIEKLFSGVFLSVELGMRKPKRGIFDTALNSTGLDAGACMYVGDTLSRDVEGARRAGFDVTVLIPSGLTDLKDRGYRGSARPDHTLRSLEEVYGILS
jgi:putative hydrolase of the HAD superfamily